MKGAAKLPMPVAVARVMAQSGELSELYGIQRESSWFKRACCTPTGDGLQATEQDWPLHGTEYGGIFG